VIFITQVWFFLTPVVYPSSLVPQKWLWLYSFNPMVGVVDGFRWTLLQTTQVNSNSVIISFIVTTAILVYGIYYFERVERSFADII
jgi:lipopolysaccharide transport system permease protein